MTILAIGGTGQLGGLVAGELAQRGADVRVLGRSRPSGGLPDGAELVTGDVLDVDFMRELLRSVDTVFLLTPAAPDELRRALLPLALLRDAGIERLVYLSMMGADEFVDAPRAAVKHATERAIAHHGVPATVLRPNAVFQNDALQLDALRTEHVYATPVAAAGVTMVDARDVAELAALELLRREQAPDPLPAETIEVVGPERLTGQGLATLWSELLGEEVAYVGDDLAAVEAASRAGMSPADAYDLALVFRPLLRDGVLGAPDAASRLAERLGRPLRTYRAFAEEQLRPAG